VFLNALKVNWQKILSSVCLYCGLNSIVSIEYVVVIF